MNTRSRIWMIALALSAILATGVLPTSEATKEIEECVQANEPKLSSVQTVTLKVVDRAGSATVSRAKIYFKKFDDGPRVLLRFDAPPDLRGSSVLLIQKEEAERTDIFMFLPELQRVRRISKRGLSGSMFGTDLTYEDFERLMGLTESSTLSRQPDSELDGRAVYVVEATPISGDTSAYTRVVSYVDRETCVPIKVEHFTKGEKVQKLISVPPDQVTKEVSGYLPRYVLVEDLKDSTKTELTVEELEVDVEIPDKLFSQRALESRN